MGGKMKQEKKLDRQNLGILSRKIPKRK